MDGKDLRRRLARLLLENDDSSYLDKRSSYDFLFEAAKELGRRTKSLTTTQDITTVANQAAYTLNGDFLGMYLTTPDNRFYIKYNDGTNDTFIYFDDYEAVIYANDTTGVTIPNRFSIMDKQTLASRVTGTCTTAGDETGNKALLTDAAGDFSDVWAGDTIHNTTDVSDGVVVAKTSTTAISSCLFGGTDNEWDSSDAYIIQPQGRFQLVLDPPPSTASHTVTVYYLQRPVPVYCDYDVYRFPLDYTEALVKYAAWLYKYRDSAPDFGDKFYVYWDRQVSNAAHGINSTRQRKAWGVNLKGRR